MGTLKEFFTSILESYEQRLRSPLIGAYTISFILYNWKYFLFLLFSSSQIEEKIEYFENLFTDKWRLILPLIIALIYILILPWVNIYFEKALDKVNEFQKEKNHKQRMSSLKRDVEVASIEYKVEEAKSGTKEHTDLRETIDNLKNENELLHNQNKEAYARFEDNIIEKEKQISSISKQLSIAMNEVNKHINEKNFLHRLDSGELYNELVLIDKKLTNNLKEVFVNLVQSESSNRLGLNSFDESILPNFSELGLISIYRDGNEKKYRITELGKSYFKRLIIRQQNPL